MPGNPVHNFAPDFCLGIDALKMYLLGYLFGLAVTCELARGLIDERGKSSV